MDSKDLKNIASVYEAVYGGGKKEEKKDTRLVVTAADKKANTKAYQNYKAGNKAYKAADHLKEGKKKVKRWWDDDGDGIGYEKGEVKKEQNELVSKEVKDLQKAAKTGKGKYVAKADKIDESIGSAVDKTLGAAGEIADTAIKLPAKGIGYLKGLKKGMKRAAKKAEDKAASTASPKNEETILEKQKDTPDQVAAVIDMYRSKKGTGEAVKDTEEGKTEAAKKERDYAAWERSKMKRDDPDWKHKKGSTTESVDADYIEIVREIKSAETQADIKRWGALKESGNFTDEELDTIIEADIADILARLEKKRISKGGDPEESPLPAMRKYHADKKKKKVKEEFELDEAERDLGDRLHRKRKLYDRTVTKAMDYARREGEAAGHARYRMGQLDREMDKVKDKMKKEK